MTDLAGLAAEVLEPGMPGYEQARRPAMARYQHIRPRAVVRCASPEDVARTLDFARRSGLPVVPRGGGHCFAGRSSTEGIVLDLRPLRSISVSESGVATIGAGALLAEVYGALDAHGRTLPAGCGETVGIAGLTLGGGLGLLGRRHGLTCDRLRAARVVLTDGRIVDCDEHREPELFWALRGAGGGQFGVVTTLVFDTVPAPQATRFTLTWPDADAAAVIDAWQHWAPEAPDELNANLKIIAVEGSARVSLFGAMLGTEAETAALTGELGVEPETVSLERMPYHRLKRSFAGFEEAEPGPVFSKSEFFREPIPAEGIAALLDVFRGEPSGHRELNFTPMGGAYNRIPAGETAFAHRTERFMLEHVASSPTWPHRSWAAVHPWGSGRVYPNFPDPDLADWAEAYHGGNHARLAEIKRRYDPGRLLNFRHAI